MANSIKSVICLSSILRPSEEACPVFACTEYLEKGGGGEGGGEGPWLSLQPSST